MSNEKKRDKDRRVRATEMGLSIAQPSVWKVDWNLPPTKAPVVCFHNTVQVHGRPMTATSASPPTFSI
jgi:hypothetical protein